MRISPSARRRLRRLVADRGRVGEAVWIRAAGDGGFDLALVDRPAAEADGWVVCDADPLPLAWEAACGARLDGALLDAAGDGFRVRLAPETDADFADEVRRVLEEGVNPLVASHGGRVRLVEAADGVARVRMEGGCQGCGSARETLLDVVVRHLEHAVPGLREVVDVTEHDAGENPFFPRGRSGGVALPVLPDAFLKEACG